jgi:DHA2 family multidrug resistance protein
LGLLMLWVGALQVMLDKGKDLDWFGSPVIVALGVVAAIAFVAWLIWELTARYPIVDLSLFARRNFTLGTVAFCVGYAVFFGNIVLLPLWLQTQLGYTATWAGLVAAPAGVVSVLVAPFVGRLVGKVDARLLGTVGFLGFAISFFMRSWLTADASFFAFVMPQLVMGIGMGTFFVAMITILLDGIPPERVPSASGVSNFLRIVASAFATSITTTFWDRHEALHQTHLAESSSIYSPNLRASIDGLQALGINNDPTAVGVLSQGLIHQAYLLSSLDYFRISGWLTLAGLVLVWLARRPRDAKRVAAAD